MTKRQRATPKLIKNNMPKWERDAILRCKACNQYGGDGWCNKHRRWCYISRVLYCVNHNAIPMAIKKKFGRVLD